MGSRFAPLISQPEIQFPVRDPRIDFRLDSRREPGGWRPTVN